MEADWRYLVHIFILGDDGNTANDKERLSQSSMEDFHNRNAFNFCFPKSDAIKLSQLSSLETESCIFLSHKLVLKREKEINWLEGSTDKLIECIKTTLLNKWKHCQRTQAVKSKSWVVNINIYCFRKRCGLVKKIKRWKFLCDAS